jgi:Zn-dependent oligopeptidase
MPPATSTAAVPQNPLNPLLADSPLPPFADIRPGHIEPAIAELLGLCRARLAEIAKLTEPTFASVVLPLEGRTAAAPGRRSVILTE